MTEEIQRIQAEYRARLLEGWPVLTGARVLEIGCGQGDMTALLAKVAAHVMAVDIADPSYGAPMTLGEATDLLKASELGGRIDFRFNFDVLRHSFEEGAFDAVVLAHSSWYFGSLDKLEKTLRRVRPWAKRLCFAEWDLEPRSLDQVPHLLAVTIQGQVAAFKTDSEANIRTPFTRSRLKALLVETGWTVESERIVETEGMQDADWEIQHCLRETRREATILPPKLAAWVEGQIDVLEGLAAPSKNRALDAYAVVAV